VIVRILLVLCAIAGCFNHGDASAHSHVPIVVAQASSPVLSDTDVATLIVKQSPDDYYKIGPYAARTMLSAMGVGARQPVPTSGRQRAPALLCRRYLFRNKPIPHAIRSRSAQLNASG